MAGTDRSSIIKMRVSELYVPSEQTFATLSKFR